MAAALQSLWRLADRALGPEAVLAIVRRELDAFLGENERPPRRPQQGWSARNAAKRSAKRKRGRDGASN
jgi:hypothetical protein